MKFQKLLFGVVCIIVLFVLGCKKTDDTITSDTTASPESDAVTLTSQGWQAFEGKDYSKAITLFRQALTYNNLYVDSYNGLGWAYGRLDSLEKAKQNFDIALGLDHTFIDSYAGRSFVSLALEKYQEAITAVSVVEQQGTKFYVFRHDSNISINDLMLVKAECYFKLGEYSSAQSIIDILDPANQLDTAKASYIEDLALTIENLWNTI
jgi:tetratricopeptide (TPR) repeat protein